MNGNGAKKIIAAFTAVVMLVLTAGCGVKYPVRNDGKIRVLQFNVQTENGNHAPFETRAKMYRKLIDELRPDVVGMEEVTVTWRKWLDDKVFNRSYASVGEPRTEGGEANPIYYRKDRFELVDSGTFWLSETPDVKGSQVDGANYPRICTWVLLKEKSTGREFIHLNTHLDHNGNNDSGTAATIRKTQIGAIIKFAQQYKDLPMFLTGDLNNRRTRSGGETYVLIQMLEGSLPFTDAEGNEYTIALADARLNAKSTIDGDHIATMVANYDESNKNYQPSKEPIDYVFYSPDYFEALSYETFLIKKDDVVISDHLPVYAVFEFK